MLRLCVSAVAAKAPLPSIAQDGYVRPLCPTILYRLFSPYVLAKRPVAPPGAGRAIVCCPVSDSRRERTEENLGAGGSSGGREASLRRHGTLRGRRFLRAYLQQLGGAPGRQDLRLDRPLQALAARRSRGPDRPVARSAVDLSVVPGIPAVAGFGLGARIFRRHHGGPLAPREAHGFRVRVSRRTSGGGTPLLRRLPHPPRPHPLLCRHEVHRARSLSR